MPFNSYAYLMALPVVAALHWALPRRWRVAFVLALSLAFYATWSPLFAWLPVALSFIAYVFGKRIARDMPLRPRMLATGIGIVLAALAVFKYAGFAVESADVLRGILGFPPWPVPAWVLPLGISFHAFQAISYLIDVSQRRVPPRSFADVLLLVLFWPHAVSGPLLRAREFLPQFDVSRLSSRLVLEAFERIVLGLVQKNVFANGLGRIVDEGFASSATVNHSTIDSWFLSVAFGLQVYIDFAAYTNLAIGSALLVGIRLPENFAFPYRAVSPTDFWRRWHMSLSRWIRDYLFFPLAARYRTWPLRQHVSLVITMGLVGLWHGAGFGFVVWGLVHGLLLTAWHVIQDGSPRWAQPRGWRAGLGWAVTFVAVMAAWVPFRAATLEQTLVMWRSMFVAPTFFVSYSANAYLATLFIVAICLAEPALAALWRRLDASPDAPGTPGRVWAFVLRPLLLAWGLYLFAVFDQSEVKFIYFQF